MARAISKVIVAVNAVAVLDVVDDRFDGGAEVHHALEDYSLCSFFKLSDDRQTERQLPAALDKELDMQ